MSIASLMFVSSLNSKNMKGPVKAGRKKGIKRETTRIAMRADY